MIIWKPRQREYRRFVSWLTVDISAKAPRVFVENWGAKLYFLMAMPLFIYKSLTFDGPCVDFKFKCFYATIHATLVGATMYLGLRTFAFFKKFLPSSDKNLLLTISFGIFAPLSSIILPFYEIPRLAHTRQTLPHIIITFIITLIANGQTYWLMLPIFLSMLHARHKHIWPLFSRSLGPLCLRLILFIGIFNIPVSVFFTLMLYIVDPY